MVAEKFRAVSNCRVCGGSSFTKYLDLGKMPLANKLVTSAEIPLEEKFPLEVLFCNGCGLSQLSIVVNPDIMFRNYVYRSSISRVFSEHCADIARELQAGPLERGDLVLDIASNDGCMLKEFKALASRVLGVDPAINLAKIASAQGIETIPEYWSPQLAAQLEKKHGKAKAVIAVNVFAHIDDLHSMVEGVKKILAPGGYFIIESPHLQSLIEHTEFDTIYHEHLSYLLVSPLAGLMRAHGMRIAKVKKSGIHGGSIRMYIEHEGGKDTSDGSVQEAISGEQKAGLHMAGTYLSFGKKVDGIKNSLRSLLAKLKSEGKTISAFGASAKGNTLLNYCEITAKEIGCIFDDTPEKQGKLYPGVHIPIVAGSELMQKRPDYLLLLAWNFSAEIMQKTRDYKAAGGKYILPIPEVKIA